MNSMRRLLTIGTSVMRKAYHDGCSIAKTCYHEPIWLAIQEVFMTVRTITVTIPEMLFLQLEAAARSSAQSLDAVVVQSLERTIPPHLVALLPTDLQVELDA